MPVWLVPFHRFFRLSERRDKIGSSTTPLVSRTILNGDYAHRARAGIRAAPEDEEDQENRRLTAEADRRHDRDYARRARRGSRRKPGRRFVARLRHPRAG